MAIERNKFLETALPKNPNLPMNKYKARRGLQRVAALLTAVGAISAPVHGQPISTEIKGLK